MHYTKLEAFLMVLSWSRLIDMTQKYSLMWEMGYHKDGLEGSMRTLMHIKDSLVAAT